MKSIKYTGERFIPEFKTNSIMALEHYHRYMLVEPYCKNKNVLDIACGAGYGSELMSKTASKVIGADIDPKVVEYCNSQYVQGKDRGNLHFEVKSVDAIDYSSDTFDIITCFETIEHISKQSQERAVSLFSDVLKDDGILFISTPSLISPLHIKDNKYHVHELSQKEFYDLLSSRFKYVRIIGQSVCLCSIIGDLKRPSDIITTEKNLKIEDCKYLIAICSNTDVSLMSGASIYVDTTSSPLVKLTYIRNKIGWVIATYNCCIGILAKISPFKTLSKKIESLKW